MKMAVAWTPLGVLAALGACDETARGVAQDTEHGAQAVEATARAADRELEQEVVEFRSDARRKLHEIDRRIEQTEHRANDATAEASVEAKQKLRELRARQRELEQRLDRLTAKSRAQWEKTRQELDKALAEFGKSANHALDALGNKIEKTLK